MDAGYHSVVWDANSHSSGVYFVKMVAGEYVNTQKLMLVKLRHILCITLGGAGYIQPFSFGVII